MDTTTLEQITSIKALKFRHQHDGHKHLQKRLNFLNAKGEYQDGRTEQCHKAECDINNVIKKYDKSGIITHINKAIAQYGDFTEVNEFQDSLNLVTSSNESFMALPSEIRKHFGNDAGTFMEDVNNPSLEAEMVKLGVRIAPEIEDTSPIEVIIKETQPLKVE